MSRIQIAEAAKFLKIGVRNGLSVATLLSGYEESCHDKIWEEYQRLIIEVAPVPGGSTLRGTRRRAAWNDRFNSADGKYWAQLHSFLTDVAMRGEAELASLDQFVRESQLGLNLQVGERGTKLSGGQKQRLGIARALVTKPKLLILDEATSSLDGQSESAISNAIRNLKGSVTLIMIAHRLSTVRFADKVIYVENGSFVKLGTFDEVVSSVPNFEKQAKLMGL
jgi:ABC-type siderophore export system fused ATPase/permease subunit